MIGTGRPLNTGQLALLDLATGDVRRLGLAGVSPQYVSTGHLVYAVEDGSVRAVPFDPAALEVTGSPVPVLDAVVVKGNGAADFSVSDTGRLVYVSGNRLPGVQEETRLVWVNRNGGEEAINVPSGRAYRYAALSPDGTRVALDIRDQDQDIWIWDLARETLDRLTPDPNINRNAVWTPEGDRVAFSAVRDGAENIYWQAADASGEPEALTEFPNVSIVPQWFSPDGNLLLFTESSGPRNVSILQLDTGESRPLLQSEFNMTNPAISPDGLWLAYESTESGRPEVYVSPFADENAGRTIISTSGGTRPLWSSDGQELYYYVDPGTVMEVPMVDGAPTGTAEVVVQGTYVAPGPSRHYSVSDDGERFLMIAPGNQTDTGEPVRPQITVVLNWTQELLERVPIK